MTNEFIPLGEIYPVMDDQDFPLMRWSQTRWYHRFGYHLVYLLTVLIPGLGGLLRWTMLMEAHHHGWEIEAPSTDPSSFEYGYGYSTDTSEEERP